MTAKQNVTASETLDNNDLKQLDSDIDANIPRNQLESLSLNKAIIHLLTFFEDYYRLYSNMNYSALRNGIDGMNYLMQWIYKSAKSDGNMDFSISDKIYALMGKLHPTAMNYSFLWDLMSETYRGKLIVEREGNKVTFKEVDKLLRDKEIADIIISHTKDRSSFDEIKDSLSLDVQEVYNSLEITQRGKNKIRYKVSDDIFNKIQTNIATV